MTRVVVPERRLVAELLAGGAVELRAGELVDEQLRAIAFAAKALAPWRRAATDEDLRALAREQGVEITGEECEALRREGGLRRAA